MDIATVTIVVRAKGGGVHKAVFDADGKCTSGDASLAAAVAKHCGAKAAPTTPVAVANDDKPKSSKKSSKKD